MNAFDLVTSRFDTFKATGPGRGIAKCPAHKDRRASLSLREFDSGAVGVHCFAGCEVAAIVGAVGLTMEDLFPPRAAPAAGAPAERRPYSVRQMVDALGQELRIAYVLLSDLANGRADFSATDRRRAGVARERCAALLQELGNVR